MAMEARYWKREAGWSHGFHRQATERDGGRVISCATVGVRCKEVLSRGTVWTFERLHSRQNNTFPRQSPKRAPDIAKCPLGGNSAPCWVTWAWLPDLLAVGIFPGFSSGSQGFFFASIMNLWNSHKPSDKILRPKCQIKTQASCSKWAMTVDNDFIRFM